jgi:small GTP-binding protein
MIRKKILLIGDFNVGKTSLIRRYVDNSFDDRYLSTIGVKISKKLCIINEVECELLIWDIEGATPSKKIPLNYYKGASGAIFVTDVNHSETFESLKEHQEVFLSQNPNAHFVTVHNKSDLLNESQKSTYTLDKYTFLTSAKENRNVENLFLTLVKEMLL